MPTVVSIPSWNAEGLLAPIDVAAPTSANRAPYAVSLSDFVLRFSTSSKRSEILMGFLNYLAALHGAGLTNGFQWVDGSFMEHVEICPRRRRPPNDVDVVTFYQIPAETTQATLVARVPELIVPRLRGRARSAQEEIPGRWVQYQLKHQEREVVDRSAYWYGVWGHQRETLKWKGFLQLDLAPTQDATALSLLAVNKNGGKP